MKISGIYQIQSIIKPERCYIGSAVSIQKRWYRHLQQLRDNNHHSKKLQYHYNKYGKNDLLFSILIGCEKEDLIITEQFYLDSHKTYFNSCKIAGSCIGMKQSDESNKKRSEALLGEKNHNYGKKLSKEHCRKFSESLKGKIPWNKGVVNYLSTVARANIGEANKKRVWSKESIEKLKEARKGRAPNLGQIAWNKGMRMSPEFCEKVKIGIKNKKIA